MNTSRITINRPDDMHLHLRDGDVLNAVVNFSARNFGRAIIMPNLIPPVTTVKSALRYRDRILEVTDPAFAFDPMMTLYLTETTTLHDLEEAAKNPFVVAVKLYPAGATTNSENGVRDIAKIFHLLEKMAVLDLPLLVHGEVTDSDIDIFDREAVFIERVLNSIRHTIPELRIVLEHVTTKDGIDYVIESKRNLYATLTVHHLILNRNDLLVGGIRPHYYCLPILKSETDRLALRQAATSGDARFFLGTDSAPHLTRNKESSCGCAGVFSSVNSLECLATVFEEDDALDKLNAFTSLNGAAFYNKPPNELKLHLIRKNSPLVFLQRIKVNANEIAVFDPQIPIYWHVESVSSSPA
ncbi:MAG: dihydroorotase [Aestuariivita sp.]|nr:dihydroorotase [Aestuariivita sp.]